MLDAIFQVGVTINLIDIVSGREDVALATSSTSTKIEETVSAVMGHKFLSTLSPLSLKLGEVINNKIDEDAYGWGVKGLLSKNPQTSSHGRTINCYSINGRIVELPKVTAVLRKVWNGFGGKKKPSCILSFTLPNDRFDINLSPDKQQVLLSDEQEILQVIQQHATDLFSSHVNGMFQVQQVTVPMSHNVEGMDDSGEGERQKHKRRFAFVHDLSKAKLQHDLADRASSHDKEDKKGEDDRLEQRVVADAQQKPASDDAEGRSSKKAKKASSHSDSPATQIEQKEQKIYDFGTLGPSFKLPERLSDLERRKWTAIQSKFRNDSTGDDIQSPRPKSQPVMPDDPLTNETADPKKTESIVKETAPPKVHSEQLQNAAESRKLSSLGKFMHQPHQKHLSSQKSPESQDVNSAANAPSLNGRQKHTGHTGKAKEPIEGFSTSAGASTSSASANARLSEISSDRRIRDQNTEVVDKTIEITDHERSGLIESGQTPSSEADEPTGMPSVIWRSFQGTEQVSHSARQERLQIRQRKKDHIQGHNRACNVPTVDGCINDVSNSVGTHEISKGDVVSLSKTEFQDGRLKVLGQFNLGFILCLCRRNNLWILDQHACDEKFNFEALCRDTILHEQKLLRPMPLDLTPSEEACILDHLDVFGTNGFHFEFKPEAPIRKRLFLTAVPHSGAQDGRKAVQFGKDDVRALCSMLSEGSAYDAGDGGTGTDGSGKSGNNAVRRYASTASSQIDSSDRLVARLPKAIAMYASRACRTSIMIGTALSRKEMEKIVSRLSDVEHPWNCPHGRPTIRHVGNVISVMINDERKAAEHISGPTAATIPITQQEFAYD